VDTRELFERLVTDEPPLSLTASSLSAHGLQVARRRRGRVAAVGLSALVLVVVIATAQLAGPDQRHSGTLAPAGEPTRTSLPFRAVSQISASGSAVYAKLLAAGGSAALLKGFPATAVGTVGKSPSLQAAVAFAAGGTSLLIYATVGSPKAAELRYGVGFAAKQSCPQRPGEFSGQPVTCVGQFTLPGGARVFSAESSPNAAATTTSAGVVTDRSALFVAADGSTLEIVESAEVSTSDGTDVPLPAKGALDGSAIIALAEQSASAWQAAASGFSPDPTAGPQPSVQQALPSLNAPALGSLPFTGTQQISASNAAVYGLLVQAAGGSSALVKGWPTWDSDPVSDTTTQLGTQVEWAAGANSAYLQVVTSTAAEAVRRYGTGVKDGPCAHRSGVSMSTPVRCAYAPLPGGAYAWNWDVDGPIPNANGAVSGTSAHGVVGRAVTVVAKDGNVLGVSEFAYRGHAVGGGTPTALPAEMPDTAALLTLADNLALAWQGAAARG
jgi:hypothetical protein